MAATWFLAGVIFGPVFWLALWCAYCLLTPGGKITFGSKTWHGRQ